MRILVPVDGSPCAAAALRVAAELAESLSATIDLVHVYLAWGGTEYTIVALDRDGGPTLDEVLHAHATAELQRLLARHLGLEHDGSALVPGDARETLVELSAHYDMMILGSHGRRGVSRLLLGSVAEHVVRRAHCPVLTVREEHVAGDHLAEPAVARSDAPRAAGGTA